VAYWQLLKELSTSGSAAPEEIDATVAAIESAMTPEQVKAIISMHITRQDMATVLRQQGGGFGTGTQRNQAQSQGTNNQRNFTFGAGGGGGGFGGPGDPGGEFAGGGGFANRNSGGQGTGTNRSSNNAQSANGNSFFTSTRAVPSALLDAVINLLKDKAKS
jgi:hypothetical protein